ncbi:sugar phosphate isomerase/epimerase [Cohnella sp. REN36]|uniref:sugar phosphate isomerase/epimerase family protein n=1 Tax=Cohnella sp. REN36 TaxID=2887347 RepID=UPI001D1598FB|nr:sugar phosphate isomerase/epimerase family protein [Cohnella sp. REN36]MCC3374190.1 sugar phosphate isomerase/epimerase [Cohnella sp. REN36]
MKLGIFTQYVQGNSIEEVAERIAGYGLQSVILDRYPGMNINLSDPSPADCARIRNAFSQAGLEIAGVGAYLNLAHPDPDTRIAIYKQMSGMIKLCKEIGAPLLCTETGSYNPSEAWDPSNETDLILQDLARDMKPLLAEARASGVAIAIESYVMTATGSTKRLARLIDMIGEDGLKVIFDPAGILSRATLRDQASFVRESFQAIAPHLGLVHVQDCTPAADIKDHFNWLCAGTGQIDYPLFMDLLIGSGYDDHLILEFLREDQIAQGIAFVEEQWDKAQKRKRGDR